MDKFSHRAELAGGARVLRNTFPQVVGAQRAERDAGGALLFTDVQGESLQLGVLTTEPNTRYQVVTIVFNAESAAEVTAAIDAALVAYTGRAVVQDGRLVITLASPDAATLTVLPSAAAEGLGLYVFPHSRSVGNAHDYALAPTTRGGEDGVGAYIVPFEDRTSHSLNRAVDAVARNTEDLLIHMRAPHPQEHIVECAGVTLEHGPSVSELLGVHVSDMRAVAVQGKMWVGAATSVLRAEDAYAAVENSVDVLHALAAPGRDDVYVARAALRMRSQYAVAPIAPKQRRLLGLYDAHKRDIIQAARAAVGGQVDGDALLLSVGGGLEVVTDSQLSDDVFSDDTQLVQGEYCGTVLAPAIRLLGNQTLYGDVVAGNAIQLTLPGAVFTDYARVSGLIQTGEVVALTSQGVFTATHIRTDGLLHVEPWAGDLNDFFLVPTIGVTRGDVGFPAPAPIESHTQQLVVGESVQVMLLVGRELDGAGPVRAIIPCAGVVLDNVAFVKVRSTDMSDAQRDHDTHADDVATRRLQSATGDAVYAPVSLSHIYADPTRAIHTADEMYVSGAGVVSRARSVRGGRSAPAYNAALLGQLAPYYTTTRDLGPGRILWDFLETRRTEHATEIALALKGVTAGGEVLWADGYDDTRAYHPDDLDVTDADALWLVYEQMLYVLPASAACEGEILGADIDAVRIRTSVPLSARDHGRLFTLGTNTYSTTGRLVGISEGGHIGLFVVTDFDAQAWGDQPIEVVPTYGPMRGQAAVEMVGPAAARRSRTFVSDAVTPHTFTLRHARDAHDVTEVEITRNGACDVPANVTGDTGYITAEVAVSNTSRHLARSAYPAYMLNTPGLREGYTGGDLPNEPVAVGVLRELLGAPRAVITLGALLHISRDPLTAQPFTPITELTEDPIAALADVPRTAAQELALADINSPVVRAWDHYAGLEGVVRAVDLHLYEQQIARNAQGSTGFDAASRLLQHIAAEGAELWLGASDDTPLTTYDVAELVDEYGVGAQILITRSVDTALLPTVEITAPRVLGSARFVDGERICVLDQGVTLSLGTALRAPIYVPDATSPLSLAVWAAGSAQITDVSRANNIVTFYYSGQRYDLPLETLDVDISSAAGTGTGQHTAYPVNITRNGGASVSRGYMFYSRLHGVEVPTVRIGWDACTVYADAESKDTDSTTAALVCRAALGYVSQTRSSAGDIGYVRTSGAHAQIQVRADGEAAETLGLELRVHGHAATQQTVGLNVLTAAQNSTGVRVGVVGGGTESDMQATRGLHVYGGDIPSVARPTQYASLRGMAGPAEENIGSHVALRRLGAWFEGPTAVLVGEHTDRLPARLNVNMPIYAAQLWSAVGDIEARVMYLGGGITQEFTDSSALADEDALSYATQLRGVVSVSGVLALSGDSPSSDAAKLNIGGSYGVSGVQGHVNPIVAPRASGINAFTPGGSYEDDNLPASPADFYTYGQEFNDVFNGIGGSPFTAEPAERPVPLSCPDIRFHIPRTAQQLGERVVIMSLSDTLYPGATLISGVQSADLKAPAFGYNRYGSVGGRLVVTPKTGLLRVGYISAEMVNGVKSVDMLVLYFTRVYFDYGDSVVGRSVRVSFARGTDVTPTLNACVSSVQRNDDYVRVVLTPLGIASQNFADADPSILAPASIWATAGVRLTGDALSITGCAAASSTVRINLLVHGREWLLNAYRVNVSDAINLYNADGEQLMRIGSAPDGDVTVDVQNDLSINAGGDVNISADGVYINGEPVAAMHTASVAVTTLIRPSFVADQDKLVLTEYDVTRAPALYVRTQEDWYYDGVAEDLRTGAGLRNPPPFLPTAQRVAAKGFELRWDYGAQERATVPDDRRRYRLVLRVLSSTIPAGATISIAGALVWADFTTIPFIPVSVVVEGVIPFGGELDVGYVTITEAAPQEAPGWASCVVSYQQLIRRDEQLAIAQQEYNACMTRQDRIQARYDELLEDERAASTGRAGDVTDDAQAEWDAYVELVEHVSAEAEAVRDAWIAENIGPSYDATMEATDTALARLAEYEEAYAYRLEVGYQDEDLIHALVLHQMGAEESEYDEWVELAEYEGMSLEEFADVYDGATGDLNEAVSAILGVDNYEDYLDPPYDVSSSTPDPAWLADNGFEADGTAAPDSDTRQRARQQLMDEYGLTELDVDLVLAGSYCRLRTPATYRSPVTVETVSVTRAGAVRRVGVLSTAGWCNWQGVYTQSPRIPADAWPTDAQLLGNADGTSTYKYPMSAVLAALRYPVVCVPADARVTGVRVTPFGYSDGDGTSDVGLYTRQTYRGVNIYGQDTYALGYADITDASAWEAPATADVLRGWRVLPVTGDAPRGDYAADVNFYNITNVAEVALVRDTPLLTVLPAEVPQPSGNTDGEVGDTTQRAVRLQLDFDLERLFEVFGSSHPSNLPASLNTPEAYELISAKTVTAFSQLSRDYLPKELRIGFRIDVDYVRRS